MLTPERYDDDRSQHVPVKIPVMLVLLALLMLGASIAAYVIERPGANSVARTLQ